MKKNIAIIGGGYTGLSAAKRLIENGFNVTIYEKTDSLGGMAKCIEIDGNKIEKHYRHIFKSDKYVIDLLKEFDLYDKMQWNETQMAYYSKEGLFKFGTPMSLLKYKPLNFYEKIRFGISIIRIKLIKNYKKIEMYTAEEWLIKHTTKSVYEKIWEPLLITKFGEEKSKISIAWLWGKINLRSTSSTSKGERLGYLHGSYDVLTNKLKEDLLIKNCDIRTNTKVDQVIKQNDKYLIKSNKEELYDYCISTISYSDSKNILNELLTEEEKLKMQKLKYTCAKTLLIVSKKSLTPFYWINIGDTQIPFGGIIEHTNMMSTSDYDNKHIIYISNYMDKNDKLYKLNANELLEEYSKHLNRINKIFKKEDILQLYCFEENDAQPVITTNYSREILNMKLNEKGIYIANMAQIYPEDRGMNYAIKTGYDVADNIIKVEKQGEV